MGMLQEVELLTGEEGESLESEERESRQVVGWCEWQSQAPPPSSSHWPTSVPVRPPAIQKSSSGPQREGSECPPTPFWAPDAESAQDLHICLSSANLSAQILTQCQLSG